MTEAERWKTLERVGAYAAGELTGEEAYDTEQFILENIEGRRLARSYARMLALLNAMGEVSSAPPEAIADYAIRSAAEDTPIPHQCRPR